MIKNSLVYLTRRCPRRCDYCTIRNGIKKSEELTVEQWRKAFDILKDLGVTFNLILGNETFLLGENLVTIMDNTPVPYGLYTSLSGNLFDKNHEAFFATEKIDSISCGIDYPMGALPIKKEEDSYKKSMKAWEVFQFVKKQYPKVDIQCTITIHRLNYKGVPLIIKQAAEIGIFTGVNFIHWNEDGKFDFFPDKEFLKDMLFLDEDLPELQKVVDEILLSPGTLQNPEILHLPLDELVNMKWHCKGDPYGGPSIDSDGSLRVCGYRKGEETPKFSIFDLPEKEKEWKRAVYNDAMKCPGCSWGFCISYKHWNETNDEMGKKVFTKHAGEHIAEEKWSKRKIE